MLRVGAERVEVEPGLLELAAPCCQWARYRVEPLASPILKLRRVARLSSASARPLNGSDLSSGSFALVGDRLEAAIPDEPPAAESALRLLYALAFLRQGMVMIHGAAASFEGRGVVFIGPSGAGKSTLARFCRQRGAQLLSDETVAIDAAGRVHGTPFRSEDDLPGEAVGAGLVGIAALAKGMAERLDSMPASQAVAALMAQVYRPPWEEIQRAELLARAGRFAAAPGIQRLTFRKDAEAGSFVRAWALGLHNAA